MSDMAQQIERMRRLQVERMRIAVRSSEKTQVQIARECGMSPTQINNVLQGVYVPSPRVCQLIIEACE